jgi:drug/metabolite transporter (DMT)-like permease
MLLSAVLLWALNITVTKYMFEHGWLPLAYATIRYFAAISIFGIYTWWRERSFRIARADWIYVGIAAAMIFVNQLCFVYSLEFARASTVSLLFGTTPMFVGLISIAFLHARLQRSFWIGAGLTLAGVGLIAAGAGGGLVSGWKGDLLAISLAVTWASYTTAIAPLMRRYSPYRISAVVLAVHGRRPGGRPAGDDLQQHAAVLRRALRAPDPLRGHPRARDRRRRAHLRRHRLRARRPTGAGARADRRVSRARRG